MRKINTYCWFMGLVLVLPILLHAQSQAPNPEMFSKSLHGTRIGKAHFYSKETGGFEQLTNIKMSDLKCMACHSQTYGNGAPVDAPAYTPGCPDCHDFSKGTTVSQEQCLGCHSRQATEIAKMQLTDVHRDKELTCTACHTKKEMHGDGTEYISMLQPGAMEAKCENCHTELAINPAHATHKEKVACASCHTKTVITCYDCHFESEVDGQTKRPAAGMKNFMFLLRREGSGQVHPATIQALTYQGKSFYTMAPFYSHNVTEEPRTCPECHGNEAIQKLQAGEKLQVVQWDAENKKLKNLQGVIPVPPNWKEALEFDHVTYTGDPKVAETDPAKWEFLKSETDLSQMLFSQPLTDEQLKKLGMPMYK